MPWFRWKNKKNEQDAPERRNAQKLPPPRLSRRSTQAEHDRRTTATGAEARGAEKQAAPRQPRRPRPQAAGRRRAPPEPPATAERREGREGARARSKPRAEPAGRARGRPAAHRARAAAPQRRRQPPRRAPLPAAKRELLISVDIGEQRVAVIEDDRVAEVYLERPERRSIAGNIYLGVVDNVLPGMEAAFVEIGLEKNGFLYVDEIVVPELEGKRHHGKKIQDLISRGEQLLVQAVKDPMKTKGARLTTEISLPGRFLVYVPNGEGLGVSRRLEDAERARLKDIIKGLEVKEGGVIVRTAAEGASAEDVERDLVFLQRLWKTIQARAKGATAPTLVYQEAELPLRIVRDLFAGDFVSAQVDNERTHKRIVSYLKKTSPHMIERVHRYKEKESLFESSGVEKEIASTLDRRVDLPSGGYLVFDYAEAFTVIDVNTGRFVGSRSKNSNQRLEDTITKNNLEAVKEVVRQLRLRDIGGIIVIDFIDMANPKNRASVEDALRDELERDRTKTYVVEISPLGLVEMTRQNVTDGPREILTRKCPTCAGDGIVVSDHTVAMQVERRLRALAAPGNRVQAYRVALHPRVLELARRARAARGSPRSRRRPAAASSSSPAEGHVHADHFEVVAEGKLVDLQPAVAARRGRDGRAQARRGRPLRRHGRGRQGRRRRRSRRRRGEARRQEGDRHDRARARRAGVRDARRRRRGGRRADHVRERGREADPRARPAQAGHRAGRRRTSRRRRRRRGRRGRRRRARAAATTIDVEDGGDVDDVAVDDARRADDEAQRRRTSPAADGATPAKKRTRRGSRGGRRRRKPPAPASPPSGDGRRRGRAEPTSRRRLAASRRRSRLAEPDGERLRGREAEGAEPAPRAADPRTRRPGRSAASPDGDPGGGRRAARADRAGRSTRPSIDADGEPTERERWRRRRRRRAGRREAQDAPRQPRRQEPPQEAGRADGAEAEASRRGGGDRRRERPSDSADATRGPTPATADRALARASRRRRRARDGRPTAPAPDEPAEPAEADDPGYVPMSEWLDDFDRR